MAKKEFKVNAIRCDHHSSQTEIDVALNNVTASLDRSWEQLEKAKKIVIKFNAVWIPEQISVFEDTYRELVDPRVMLGVFRLLKERTTARLSVLDTTLTGDESDVYFKPMLKEMDVEFINGSTSPVQWYEIKDGGLMFNRYLLSSHFADADAVVSVAKMKSHKSTGITLCTKNLFGCSPLPPSGRPRTYFHHMVRLPYCMVDFAMILKPCLNIIEGLTSQTGSEWHGEGVVTDLLMAGDHATAIDACGARLMGVDPTSDWPKAPFRRERNTVLLAEKKGFGTLDMDKIDFTSEVSEPAVPAGTFNPLVMDSPKTIFQWRKSACEQALYYRDHRDKFVKQYENEYIFLQKGKVVWHGDDPSLLKSRRELSGRNKTESLFLKFVEREETEQENYSIYEKELEDMDSMNG